MEIHNLALKAYMCMLSELSYTPSFSLFSTVLVMYMHNHATCFKLVHVDDRISRFGDFRANRADRSKKSRCPLHMGTG